MTKRKAETHIFKVIFTSQGQVYEIYAAHVAPAEMFGFIEVEQILFGERNLPKTKKIKTGSSPSSPA